MNIRSLQLRVPLVIDEDNSKRAARFVLGEPCRMHAHFVAIVLLAGASAQNAPNNQLCIAINHPPQMDRVGQSMPEEPSCEDKADR